MELEEAINILKRIDIKFFLNGSLEQSNYIIETADKVNKAIETVLQTLENSIPKEVIEKKIAELWIKCPKNSINKFMINERNNKIEVLQEILEGK